MNGDNMTIAESPEQGIDPRIGIQPSLKIGRVKVATLEKYTKALEKAGYLVLPPGASFWARIVAVFS